MQVLSKLIPHLIPKFFLEDYYEALKLINKMKWPQNIFKIYTANGFAGDNIFQLWTAEKIELGAKYIIGQHGNNYGTLRKLSYSPELTTADNFISWGWKNLQSNNNKIIPFYNFIYSKISKKTSGILSNILIVMKGKGNRSSFSCRSFEFYHELESVQKLVISILKKTNLNLTIRFHNNTDVNTILKFKSMFSNKFGNRVQLDYQGKNIKKLFYNHDLVVFSYDSTGFLQCLQNNIPVTAMFLDWDSRLLPQARVDYDNLKKIKLIHNGLESQINLILKLNRSKKIWNNWCKDVYKDINVKNFINRYSKNRGDEDLSLSKLLLSL